MELTREISKRFEVIEDRIESLEINSKENSLKGVIQFLNSKPDELDEIFIFKLTLKQLRELIKLRKDEDDDWKWMKYNIH